MDELKVFINQQNGLIRRIEIDGKQYAVGIDVAEALGYTKPSQAVIDHCKDIRKQNIFFDGEIKEFDIIPMEDIDRLMRNVADQSNGNEIQVRVNNVLWWITNEVTSNSQTYKCLHDTQQGLKKTIARQRVGYMKYCTKHGKQRDAYTFCPFCGQELVEKDSEYILPDTPLSDDPMLNLVFYEARAVAWSRLGLRGEPPYRLAKHNILPQELKEILKHHTIRGISKKTIAIIEQLDEQDFKRFNECYEKLIEKDSWVWKFVEWYYSLPYDCTNGEYAAQKAYYKKQFKRSETNA